MASSGKRAFRSEVEAAKHQLALGNKAAAFRHLERAHIVGQLSFYDHAVAHVWMIRVAIASGDRRELLGQVVRLLATVPGHLFGWIPIGNTGGSNVSPIKPMPIPADLTPHFAGFSLRRQIMRQWLIILFLTLAGATFLFARGAYARAGETMIVASRGTDRCEKLAGYEGAEDILIDEERRVAYAVGGNRRSFRGGGPGRATIRSLSLGTVPSAPAADLAPAAPAVFRSFGADLHVAADGTRRLFVASRPDDAHTVEVFRLGADGRWLHERTFSSPLLRNPNEVVALGPDRVLVTLDKDAAAGTLAEVLEGVLDRPSGRVLMIGPDGARIVADGLRMANGIVLSHDGRAAYVAEMVGRQLAVFDRDPATERWTLRHRIPLPAGPDNLTLHRDGRVLAAAHPKLLTLAFGYQHDENRPSPSMILAIDPVRRTVETMLSSDGREIAGGSVAAHDAASGILLIGSAFGPHILRCRGVA